MKKKKTQRCSKFYLDIFEKKNYWNRTSFVWENHIFVKPSEILGNFEKFLRPQISLDCDENLYRRVFLHDKLIFGILFAIKCTPEGAPVQKFNILYFFVLERHLAYILSQNKCQKWILRPKKHRHATFGPNCSNINAAAAHRRVTFLTFALEGRLYRIRFHSNFAIYGFLASVAHFW